MPKRLLTAGLALYTLVIASGAPLPLTWVATSGVPKVESAERFPCESSPCGCTADRCWTSCCCHTMAERLAWARREGVRPPEEALTAAQFAGHDVSDWVSGVRVEPTPAAVIEVTTTLVEDLPPCCRQRLAEAKQAVAETKQPRKRTLPPQGVALLHALACQGAVDAWLSLGEAPTPPSVELIDERRVAPVSECVVWLDSIEAEAPTPPPPERAVRSLS